MSGRTIALVACSKSKRDRPAEAYDLYTGDLFRKSRAWAERYADAWYILSAEHGLVLPTRMLAPYERTLGTAAERRAWAERVAGQMGADNLLGPDVEIIWLAGLAYEERLSLLLYDRVSRQRFPLADLRIGQRLAWLKAELGREL